MLYLELVLRLRKLRPDLVPDYFGPDDLGSRVAEEPRLEARELLSQAGALLEHVESAALELGRRRWLSAHLQAIQTVCRWLDGEELSYGELAAGCYGVMPVRVCEERFELAHRMLDDALPGSGDLRSRYRRWVASQTVPPERLNDAVEALAGELSVRARARFCLPDDERVTFELVSGEPWLAFAGPLGAGRTLVRINRDQPIAAFRLLDIVGHEGYPGHHCEAACKAAALSTGRGWSELLAWGYCLPQAMLSEGLAELALEALLGSQVDEVGAAVLCPLGIPYDAPVAAAVRRTSEMLGAVRTNLAMMLDDDTISRRQAWDYLRTWRLEDDEYVNRALASLLNRFWKPYESCYTDGLDLCRRFVDGDPAKFQRLLSEPLIPHDLLSETAHSER